MLYIDLQYIELGQIGNEYHYILLMLYVYSRSITIF